MNPTLLGNLIVRLISGFIKVADVVQITAAILWWHGLEPQKRWNPCVALAVVVFVARNLSSGTGATTPLCRWRQPGGFRERTLRQTPGSDVQLQSCREQDISRSGLFRIPTKQTPIQSETNHPLTDKIPCNPATGNPSRSRSANLPPNVHLARNAVRNVAVQLNAGSSTESRLRRSVRFRTPPDHRDSGFIG